MKKGIAFLLAAILLCGVFSACSSPAPTEGEAPEAESEKTALVGSIPVSFPLVSQGATLKIMTTAAGNREQDGVFVWQKYEEMTGVEVEWTELTKAERSEAVHNALTNGQKVDLIMRCKLSATRLLRYGKGGLILDLAKDGLLQENAPNCWAYLQAHPDTLASVMNPDGSIYALPQVNSGAELRVAQKIYVNKNWLSRVGMELPSTTEELYELLKAFKEQDANGNGDTEDEIPLCSPWGNLSMGLYGSFGLANRGYHNETVDWDEDKGEVRLIAGCDEYRDFLSYMNRLYSEGLMDKNLFTVTLEQMTANAALDKMGVFVNTNLALIPADKLDDWVVIDEALTGPKGDKLFSAIRANFHSTGAAVIPATCADPALVLRWLDYFWTDEGTLFYHMGVEGETYTVLPDGAYDYTDEIYQEMSDKKLSFDEVISEYSPYPGGSNPTVEIAPYFMGGEMAEMTANAAKSLMDYGPEEYWPGFTFTQEENDALSAINGDMSKYCESMRTDFITGARSLEQWNEYTAKLQALGAQELLDIYQNAVDRYHALSTALN